MFRDEIADDGEVRRFIGVLRSVVEDGRDGVLFLDEAWRARAHALADLGNADAEINRYRFCTYHGGEGVKGCGKCISYCPAGALANSSPERGQLAGLYDEWMCGRCLSICGGEGNRSRFAAENYAAYVAGTVQPA